MLFIAYYTRNTPYEQEAVALRASLDALGLWYDIRGVDSLGSWQKNTQYKARFVREMLNTHLGPMTYIDVDALVLQPPVLLDTLDCDIAAAKFGGHELLSGTVYFGNTPKSRETVDRWIALCEQYPDRFPGGLLPHFPSGGLAWDQRMLDIAIRQTGAGFVELPPEYTYIVELSQKRYPGVQPVILHTRGSLRFKAQIDGR